MRDLTEFPRTDVTAPDAEAAKINDSAAKLHDHCCLFESRCSNSSDLDFMSEIAGIDLGFDCASL